MGREIDYNSTERKGGRVFKQPGESVEKYERNFLVRLFKVFKPSVFLNWHLWKLCKLSPSHRDWDIGLVSFLKWSEVKVAQLCLTLCDPMDCTVYGIVQARILEWVAFPFSRGSSQPRDRTQISHIAGRFSFLDDYSFKGMAPRSLRKTFLGKHSDNTCNIRPYIETLLLGKHHIYIYICFLLIHLPNSRSYLRLGHFTNEEIEPLRE